MNVAVFLQNPSVREWTVSPAQLAALRAALPAGSAVADCASEPAFVSALSSADAAMTWVFRQPWFARAPRLRLLATPAAGHEYLAVSPPPSVSLSFGTFHGLIIAETVLSCMLGFARGTLLHSSAMRADGGASPWPRGLFSGSARRLAGSTVVIVGFGHIGRHIGRLARSFGACVVGVRRSAPSAADSPDWFSSSDRVVPATALDSVLPLADHLVFALPDDPSTTGILDSRRLALLKPSAFVYNIGRGNCIDEPAIAAALRSGTLAAAALDVFRREPLPADSPLRSAPNCLLFPHSSAIAPDYLDLALGEFAARAKEALRHV